jgi:hypothetical protein
MWKLLNLFVVASSIIRRHSIKSSKMSNNFPLHYFEHKVFHTISTDGQLSWERFLSENFLSHHTPQEVEVARQVWQTTTVPPQYLCTVENFPLLIENIGLMTKCAILLTAEDEIDLSFDSLARNGILTFRKLIKHSYIQDMIQSEIITTHDIKQIWNDVLGESSKHCDAYSFRQILVAIQQYIQECQQYQCTTTASSAFNTQQVIVIRASEIASCVGRNPYKSVEQALEEIWARYDSNFATLCIEQDELLNLLLSDTSGKISQFINSAENEAKSRTKSEDVMQVVERKAKEIESLVLLPAQQKLILEHIQQNVSLTHGTISEVKTATIYQDQVSTIKSKVYEDQTMYSTTILQLNGIVYKIVGKFSSILYIILYTVC